MLLWNASARAIFLSASIHAVFVFSAGAGNFFGTHDSPGTRKEFVAVDLVKAPAVSGVPPVKVYPKPKAVLKKPHTPNGEKIFHEKERLRKRVVEEIKKFSASELAGDPQTGKVFIQYFSEVKSKIYDELRRQQAGTSGSEGMVTVTFVLGRDGSLKQARVADKQSQADHAVRVHALEVIQRSAPFGPFPETLGSSEITFSLKIYFDDMRVQ